MLEKNMASRHVPTAPRRLNDGTTSTDTPIPSRNVHTRAVTTLSRLARGLIMQQPFTTTQCVRAALTSLPATTRIFTSMSGPAHVSRLNYGLALTLAARRLCTPTGPS
jgi:hypothetical protein